MPKFYRMKRDEPAKEVSFWRSIGGIFTYQAGELNKKPRSFKIGVFTIFIVVAFLTMLQSTVDVAPIAFVSIS